MLVALGGAVGSICRYLVAKYLCSSFPLGTFTVNLVGALLIGILVGMMNKGVLSLEMKLLFVTGFCGSFTTFSTFASETLTMLKAGDVLLTALYAGGSVALGILAVYLGTLIISAVF